MLWSIRFILLSKYFLSLLLSFKIHFLIHCSAITSFLSILYRIIVITLSYVILVFIDCEKISVHPLESVRHLILGSVYSNSGEIAKAKMHYISALREGELQGDVHTSAFASYELGMLLCKSYEVRRVLNYK